MNKNSVSKEDFESSIIKRLIAVFEVIEVINKKVDHLVSETKKKDHFSEEIQNAVAAKIIQEICEKMDRCECIEKIIEFLKSQKITLLDDSKKEKPFGLHKYSYPNYDVGNASLGSSGNPNAMTWPFGSKK